MRLPIPRGNDTWVHWAAILILLGVMMVLLGRVSCGGV